MKRFLIQRWFLIVLAAAIVGGISAGEKVEFLLEWKALRYGIVATVMFLMALPLEATAMWRATRRPWVPLLAVAISFGLLPLTVWCVSWGLKPELAGGLFVVAATPCSLASATVWTRRAGGNDSVAILVTIVTNASCFVITPLWLFALTGMKTQAISLTDMMGKLAVLVVLPLALAQLLRLSRSVACRATAAKIPLGVAAQCGVLSMVFLGAIRTGQRLAGAEGMYWIDWLLTLAAVAAVHLFVLWSGYLLAGWLGFSRADGIAVGLSGSQKTLVVGLQIAMDCGLEPLPMVAYHISQLLIDTLIADRWRRQKDAVGPNGTDGAA